MQLGLIERDEVEKRADDDMERLQDEVQLFKVMNYKKGYRDGALGKSPRYSHGDEETLVQKAFEMPFEALAAPGDAPNTTAGTKIGEGSKLDPQAETYHEHHVSVV